MLSEVPPNARRFFIWTGAKFRHLQKLSHQADFKQSVCPSKLRAVDCAYEDIIFWCSMCLRCFFSSFDSKVLNYKVTLLKLEGLLHAVQTRICEGIRCLKFATLIALVH